MAQLLRQFVNSDLKPSRCFARPVRRDPDVLSVGVTFIKHSSLADIQKFSRHRSDDATPPHRDTFAAALPLAGLPCCDMSFGIVRKFRKFLKQDYMQYFPAADGWFIATAAQPPG